MARNNQGKKNNKVSLLGSRLTAAVGSDSFKKDVDYAHRPSMEQIKLSRGCQALSPSAQMLEGPCVVPRPPWLCHWEEFLPAVHPGKVVDTPLLGAVMERFDEHLSRIEKHNPG